MKKRLVAFIAFLALVFSFTSCNFNNLKHQYTLSDIPHTDRQEFDYTSLVNNELPAEKIIGKALDIHDIAEEYLDMSICYTTFSLFDILDGIGVECLRKTDAGTLYSIHKIKQGGKLYIFYLDLPDDSPSEDKTAIRWFYVRKELTSQDFEGIQEGSTMDDVKKIDPATQIYENIYNAEMDKKRFSKFLTAAEYFGYLFASYHYLTDGVLELTYKEENGKLVVVQKLFIEDFELHQYSASRTYPYDGHLLPIDQFQ